jgi:surface antigen/Ni/Co efflux regulator RcnB
VKKLILSATALTFLASTVATAMPVTKAQPAVQSATLSQLVQYRGEDRGGYDRRSDGYDFQRGDRLPRSLRDKRYVYYDWRESNLPRPLQGYQWLLIGDQYVLASIANGQIRDVRDVERMERRAEREEWREERRAERQEFREEQRREDRRERREYTRAEREAQWRARYARQYNLNDDAYYRECRNRPDPAGALVGAVIGGLLGNAAGNRRNETATTIMGVVAGGAIGAALTNKLDCNDRSYAYKTYTTGFNAGRANAFYDWQNPQSGTRGQLHVLDYYQDEDNFNCAVYSQKIWIDGRPEEARGRACQQPDGAWAIID